MNNLPRMNFGIKGEKRVILRDLMGNPVLDTGWSDNLITNTGLIGMLDNSSWGTHWCLGTNGTAPQTTDNSITLLKRMTASTGVTNVRTNSGSPNYIMSHTDSKRWEAGTGGTVREFGLCSSTDGTGAGVRTTVTPEIVKGTDQILDFYYRMTATPNLIDRTGTITVVDAINGNKNYDYTARGMNVDAVYNVISADWAEGGSYLQHKVYDGDISADATGAPAGNSDNSDTATPPVQVGSTVLSVDTATRTYRITIGVDDGNWATGIRSLGTMIQTMASTTSGMQVEFDDPLDTGKGIIKTTNDRLTFDCSISVTRI